VGAPPAVASRAPTASKWRGSPRSLLARALAPSTAPAVIAPGDSQNWWSNDPFLKSVAATVTGSQAPTTRAFLESKVNTGFNARPAGIMQRLANALTSPTSASPAAPTAFSPTPDNVIPFPGSSAPASSGSGGGGGGSGGGGGGGGSDGGAYGGGPATDSAATGEDDGDGGGGGTDYPGDENDSGGYSEYGGGDPADSYGHDAAAIRATNALSPPDVGDYEKAPDGAAYDNDDDEDSGGQDMPQVSTSRAPEAPSESWSYRDRARMSIPAHMYDAPAFRPGGEEGDDTMYAGDYVAALNGYGAGMGGFSDFIKSLGKDVAVTTLNASSKALGGSGAKAVVVPTAPPMSMGAKVLIAAAIGVPALYFLTRSHGGGAPAVAHNPRRRHRRRARR